jgi:hypothetical protein
VSVLGWEGESQGIDIGYREIAHREGSPLHARLQARAKGNGEERMGNRLPIPPESPKGSSPPAFTPGGLLPAG